jgi:glycine/D-amino acid oxidase-like deaminating enzyme
LHQDEFSAAVCVLGAGLTGSTVALELAQAGVDVIILDQDHCPMNRASLRNEGKIHLGFVYAKDDSLATPDLMLEGALSFRRILRNTLGARMDGVSISSPFTYLVASDSLVAPDDLQERYDAIERRYTEKLQAQSDNDYLGYRAPSLFERIDLGELSPRLSNENLLGAFRTAELAVNPLELAEAIRAALAASPRIRFMSHRKVETVERRAGQFRVFGTGSDGPWRIDAGQIVNALWDRRMQIDQTIGVENKPGWVHRLKYSILVRLPDRLCAGPSATMVVGPYGDVVSWPDGTAWFSWYPLGLQGWSHELAPPDSWDGPCKGEANGPSANSIALGILSAIDRWYPGALEAELLRVDAGAIVAYGHSDVDDPDSGLHERTRVGVTSIDGYHTVDPGKLTTAPLFGLQAAQRVLGLESAS